MANFIFEHYFWVKSFHIIAVMAWMAGMLYLPRLYVYHAGAAKGSDLSETLKVMERRLLRIIINPAMIAAWAFGIMMIYANPELLGMGWLHAKFACLIAMQIVHALFARWRRHFANDANRHSAKFYRIVNEVPTALLIAIVIMAVAKPF